MNKRYQKFADIVLSHYNDNARRMPWREAPFDPYRILVSEIMLQQTQVDRVIPKFEAFIAAFPDASSLAKATLGEVIKLWTGLGYNRRAKYLHDAAKQLSGTLFPRKVDELTKLKGIGHNTAAAVLVYSYNQPHLFIETNIRTVYMHHFFNDEENVDDARILELLKKTIDTENPRKWYWALMDYGAHLKKSGIRNNNQSKHYTKQSKFEGSQRQLRGEILRRAQRRPRLQDLKIHVNDKRFDKVVLDLKSEGLIVVTGGHISIP